MTTTRLTIFAAALALTACGRSPVQQETEATRAVDRFDEAAPASRGARPAGGDLAVSTMGGPIQLSPQDQAPTPAGTPPTGETLAVSSMGGMPPAAQPMAPPPIAGQPAGQLPAGTTAGADALPSYPPRSGITTGRLCAAAVGSILGMTELQLGIEHETPALARVGYQKADRTRWTYDCRFDGSHITWRTVEDGRPGRWRTDPGDEVITFSMTPQGANVTVDGEVVRIAA